MSKLFKLKEWVTVPDAAKRLSVTLGEEVTEADLLKLSLDGHLRLSVHFVNHATARYGRIGVPGKARYVDFPTDMAAALKAKSPGEYQGGYTKLRMGVTLQNGEVIDLEDEIVTLDGVYDLPMIGGERLGIEQKFQGLTDGPSVTLTSIDGAFVEFGGVYYQLQEDYDDNEYQRGSLADLDKLRMHIATKKLDPTKAEALLNEHKEMRKKFLESRKSQPKKEHYFPASGLPDDSVLVVRTDALIEFEQSLKGELDNVDKPLSTTERNTLLKLVIGMAVKGYSFDPAASRSATPKEIADDLAALGIAFTDDTVRKYLKQAANTVLPGKPRQS